MPAALSAIVALPSLLFPFQSAIVRWALRKGRAAIFADTGLGKSFMQSAWIDALPIARRSPASAAKAMKRSDSIADSGDAS